MTTAIESIQSIEAKITVLLSTHPTQDIFSELATAQIDLDSACRHLLAGVSMRIEGYINDGQVVLYHERDKASSERRAKKGLCQIPEDDRAEGRLEAFMAKVAQVGRLPESLVRRKALSRLEDDATWLLEEHDKVLAQIAAASDPCPVEPVEA